MSHPTLFQIDLEFADGFVSLVRREQIDFIPPQHLAWDFGVEVDFSDPDEVESVSIHHQSGFIKVTLKSVSHGRDLEDIYHYVMRRLENGWRIDNNTTLAHPETQVNQAGFLAVLDKFEDNAFVDTWQDLFRDIFKE